ncbi:MAG TPA: ATPase, T2SS/T4P/T4SS family [Thermoleophilaceae bacterium]|jgi:type IV pilus assembly protein PilB
MSTGSETVAPAAEQAVPGLTPPTPHSGAKPRIGDVIVALGYADRETVDKAVEASHEQKRPTGQILLETRAIDSRQLAHALADRSGFDFVDLDTYTVDMGAANLIDMAAAKRFRSVPIAFLDQDRLLVATADPANVLAVDDIAMSTGYEVRMAVASPEDIEALVGQLSRLDQSISEVEEEAEDEAQVIELRESADEAPVVKLVHSVIADAVNRGASDIHFDPRDGDMRVRFRVDGVVNDSTTVPRALVPGLLSRIKIMAELDISERRIPQDGRVGFTVDNRKVDIRVATLPVVRGEAVVMRILDKGRVVMQLDRLGMHVDDRERFHHAIKQSHGGVLVTGPTGSGKTTSLYAALHEINTPDKTIITIEDPVEYELEGVKQVQVNNRTGLTFAAGLRSMVRSDPDIIMVGEIRDKETAQIAVESALTGHLVLSTLHTNDAPMAAARLIEMGIEPFLVASGVECVMAQRLARRLCDCKEPTKISPERLAENGFEGTEEIDACEPGGCVRCGGTGYKGRVGLYEVMTVTDEIRKLILDKADGNTIREVALRQGMRAMRQDGIEKVGVGVTSIEEVLRALGTARS